MGILESALTFVSSMHISAIIIISIILLIFFLSFIFNLVLRAGYSKLRRDFEKQSASGRNALSDTRGALSNGRGAASGPGALDGLPPIFDRFSEPRFRSALLRSIVSDYEGTWTSQKGAEVNTQAIIENNFNSRMKLALLQESCARHSVSVMIVLGLLGTFIGLTISVQSLVLLFQGYDVTELLTSVEAGLLSALSGMSTAFTTSLFGIACSVIITIINVFINPGQAREHLMVGIEEYLDNTVSARLRAAAGDGYEKMNEALRNTFIDFGERIAERFDRALTTMRDDVRGIEEVNNNLRNTIEHMDVSFVRIADALKASTRHIDDNYQALAALSTQFREVSDGFDNVRKENAAHSENLVNSVNEAAQAISGLTGDLRGEAQRRLDNFTAYEEAISRMAASAELIRSAVAAIPDQMYAYSEASKIGADYHSGQAAPAGGGFPAPDPGDPLDFANTFNETPVIDNAIAGWGANVGTGAGDNTGVNNDDNSFDNSVDNNIDYSGDNIGDNSGDNGDVNGDESGWSRSL